MLINKWIVTSLVNNSALAKMQTGICFYLKALSDNAGNFYSYIQKELFHVPFSVLLSGTDFNDVEPGEKQIEQLLGLFFQPSYYFADYQPVLFLENPTSACTLFLARLQNKCRLQGLKRILIIEIRTEEVIGAVAIGFGFWTNTARINYESLIRDWLTQYLIRSQGPEIHLLVPYNEETSKATMNEILQKENALQQTPDYKIAKILYEKDRLIETYRNELASKEIAEKNNRLYLSIQQEERANALEWYNREYEVLPLWYKRFGHVIKVLTGKRTFRSLFDDNVKKYID